MFKSVEDLQQLSRSQMEATSQSAAAVSRGLQQIALEASDFSKKSIEDGSAAFGKFIGVKSLDGAIQVQSEFAKTSYDHFVASYTRFGELFSTITKEAYKPFEGAFEQAQSLVK